MKKSKQEKNSLSGRSFSQDEYASIKLFFHRMQDHLIINMPISGESHTCSEANTQHTLCLVAVSNSSYCFIKAGKDFIPILKLSTRLSALDCHSQYRLWPFLQRPDKKLGCIFSTYTP